MDDRTQNAAELLAVKLTHALELLGCVTEDTTGIVRGVVHEAVLESERDPELLDAALDLLWPIMDASVSVTLSAMEEIMQAEGVRTDAEQALTDRLYDRHEH